MDNPQAFPRWEGDFNQSKGMTIRDYFAGQALIGLVTVDHDMGIELYASDAYKYADAMLKERDKNEHT